jgi:hypothetical protein
MPKVAFFLILILLASAFTKSSFGFYDVDLAEPTPQLNIESSDIIKIASPATENQIKRYIVFGSGSISDVRSSAENLVYGISSHKGFFSVGTFYQNDISKLHSKGYKIIEDFQLEFDSIPKSDENETMDGSRIGLITGSEEVFRKFGFDGKGITIGIVDTGTDFSNPDVRDSLARDENNHPIMIDADGQGLVLTNSTFVANINHKGVITNYTKPIPKNITSSVYVNSEGVFLNLAKKGNGTSVLVFNSLFPSGGAPVLNGTVSNDMKIGKNNKDYLISKSGIYHLGVIYQGTLQGTSTRLQLVPVLVLDSTTAGIYDTVVPDMSTSWIDFTRFESSDNKPPKYDFDFTDEEPITLGNGKEFFLYDSDKDGKFDYSSGTLGARVLDVYGVINKPSSIDPKIRATNGTLLSPIDPEGNYIGVMYDFQGHGTSSAASITSKGIEKYDIYDNSTKYSLKGVAPGAKIVPIKALWFGDAVYAWLWASGFNQENNNWIFEGKPRVDIISNSWGVSTFPTIQSVPGLDVLSLVLSTLTVPGSIDKNYPGVLVVSSAGNAGHGYGTIGLPNVAPYGLSVGATTNNVYVGHGPFKNQPRFGNSTISSNEIVDFSSRGPGIIGDPKPDIMSIGAYSFTPSSITKKIKNATDPYTMFGGTSLSGPLVSGSAAIVMESMKQQDKKYDPFKLKNILLSTATDLENDPFTQGTGIVNIENAVNFVNGKTGTFIVYNNASYANIKKILDVPINMVNSSSFGIENFQLSNSSLPMTPWFGGRLLPSERTFATFTIENPTNKTLDITIKPQNLELVKKYQYNGTTEVRLQDPLINKTGIFRPNYVHLEKIIRDADVTTLFEKKKSLPNDASLMILNLNFPFDNFMNKTEKMYANDMKISSLYLYDWNDKNNDTAVAHDELSMVNRGGSWGTVQELRISEPNSKFNNVPLVGVYPVPTKYSYWIGDTKKNSTSMDYTITASFYKKEAWESIWVNYDHIQVKPNSSSDLIATIIVPQDSQPGIYQGFMTFQGDLHEVNVPVSYAVMKNVLEKDLPTVIDGSQKEDILYGNGLVSGAFDMTNRYNAGDWRQYHFDVKDYTINSVAFDISWENKNTNLSVFVIDPAGRIVQTNVPPGVLGHFQGWPTGDWLGTSAFSEGGGFFPIKNKDDTSTVLYAPINQTGTYSLLMHSTLFEGKSLSEPITVAAKFSTILPDEKIPQILFIIPEFINSTYKIQPEIIEENIGSIKYFLDENEILINSESKIPSEFLTEGAHTMKVIVTDTVGHSVEKTVKFKVDNNPPELFIKSPINGSTVSNIIYIDVDISDENLPNSGGIKMMLPNGTHVNDKFVQLDTSTIENGEYDINISANDLAGNEISKKIIINIENRPFFETPQVTSDQNIVLLQGIIIGIAIATASIIIMTKTKIYKKH